MVPFRATGVVSPTVQVSLWHRKLRGLTETAVMKCWELLFSSLIGRDFRELVYLIKWFADELWVFAKVFDTTLGMFHVSYPLVDGAAVRGPRPCPDQSPAVFVRLTWYGLESCGD